MARGRRTKLTAQVQEKICQYIRLGMAYERAAILSGICERTFWRWKVRGDTAKSGIYFEFCQALKLADADAELLHVQNLKELAIGGRKYREYKHKLNRDGSHERTITTKVLLPDAESSKWILGRRFRERWGNEIDETNESNKGSPAEAGDDGLDELLADVEKFAAEETETDPDAD